MTGTDILSPAARRFPLRAFVLAWAEMVVACLIARAGFRRFAG